MATKWQDFARIERPSHSTSPLDKYGTLDGMLSPSPVLQLQKSLQISADVTEKTDSHWNIRSFRGPQDIDVWLEVQNSAFRAQRPIPWTASHFRRELADRPWWSAQRLWFAESATGRVVGSLALELDAEHGRMHWLAVLSSAQRRGVARCLLQTAERHCRQHGAFVLKAETAADSIAEQFYRRHGFKNG